MKNRPFRLVRKLAPQLTECLGKPGCGRVALILGKRYRRMDGRMNGRVPCCSCRQTRRIRDGDDVRGRIVESRSFSAGKRSMLGETPLGKKKRPLVRSRRPDQSRRRYFRKCRQGKSFFMGRKGATGFVYKIHARASVLSCAYGFRRTLLGFGHLACGGRVVADPWLRSLEVISSSGRSRIWVRTPYLPAVVCRG